MIMAGIGMTMTRHSTSLPRIWTMRSSAQAMFMALIMTGVTHA